MIEKMDIRYHNFARILVEYSTKIQPGDKVAIRSSTTAAPMVQELYSQILRRGAHPHLLMELPDQGERFFANARDENLDYLPVFDKIAFEEFDVLLKLPAQESTRFLSRIDPQRLTRYQKTIAPLIEAQFRRGASGELRWMSTIFPTHAHAVEADMGYEAFADFFFRACHADAGTADPVAYWHGVQKEQQRFADYLNGHDQVELHGPDVDLKLSIKGRRFENACGQTNMPDGEIFTGPVEDSVSGWVRFTYPAVYLGALAEGVELKFEEGKIVKASAEKNQDFLIHMLDTDPGARYLGEFAIGLNYEIDQFMKNILLDEKIGGSFHIAMGAGYPETGSKNKSAVHWDMICDMRRDSEIRVDGEVVYRDGRFII
jgi:aminopeptidase